MATTLHMQGGDIELNENFNKVRHRLNESAQLMLDYKNGNVGEDDKFQPFHLLSFATGDGGRVSVNPEKVIAVSSDEAKDVGESGE